MNYQNIAQPWTATGRSPSSRLPTLSNPSFIYMHHPKNWELHILTTKNGKKTEKKPIWVPGLTRLKERPGVNNVRGTINRPDSSIARTNFRDKGFTILHPKDHDYLRIYPAQGGNFHTLKWMKLETLAGELIQELNKKEFLEWKISLVQEQIVKLPHKHILKKLRLEQLELIRIHQSKPHLPHAVEMSKESQEFLKQMDIATEAIDTEGIKYYE